MKKHEIIFSAVKVPLDFAIVFLCFFLARKIRLITDLIPWVNLPIQTIETWNLVYFALLWALLYIFLFSTHWLYNIKIINSKVKEFLDIIRYGIYWFLFFSVGVYLWNGIIYTWVEIPRLIILFTFIFATLWVVLERIILNNVQRYMLSKDIIPKRKLMLISNKNAEKLKPFLEDIKNSKIYEIIWYVNTKNLKNNIKYLGWIEKTEKLIQKWTCDEILHIDSDFSKKELLGIWNLSKIFGVRYRYVTNVFDVTASNTTMSLINNIPVIEIKNTPLDNWWRIIKRCTDIIWSMIWIIIFAPIMILVAILTKIENPKAPIIYKNKRIGQNWESFYLYKFRYLKWEYCIKEAYGIENKKDPALKYEQELIKEKDARDGPLYKIKNDPRKTKLWAYIERYSIDELPQFFNVLLGQMSLVGPRPHQPREVKKYKLYQKRLLTIKPGITGMAQVNGRAENNFVKEAKLDIFYIENWNLILDIKIILKTFTTLKRR